jgi:O-methyltransferase/methyltransferase family protein
MEISELAANGWFSRALAVAARLGIADVMAGESMSHTDIAKHTGSDPSALLLLMQALTALGVVERTENGDFRVSEKFAPLRTDHPRSMRHFCMLAGGIYDDAWGALLHTVQTGKSGFRKVFGTSLYEYLEDHPETARVFDNAMVELARPVAAALVRQYDFAEVRKVVDIGGGSGAMLCGILAEYSQVTGVCADRQSVCERAAADLCAVADQELVRRISFQPTDFFAEVPEGGDRYLLKSVLHHSSYDSGLRILTTVGRAMSRTAQDRHTDALQPRLLVLEPLIEQDRDAWRELSQILICEEGTRGLNEENMRTLLEAAGFEVLSVSQLDTGYAVFECAVRSA